MKTRAKWLLIPVLALGLGACKKPAPATADQSPPAAVDPTTPVIPPAPAAPEAPAAPKIGAAERAAKLGFARHLPQDTEAVISFYNGTKIADRVKSSRFWSLVQAEMGGGPGMMAPEPMPVPENEEMDPPEAEQEPVDPDTSPLANPHAPDEEPMGPAAMFGIEFTVAMGKGTGEQFGNLMAGYRRLTYFQMRNMAKAFAAAVKSGDSSAFSDAMENSYGGELMTDFMKDPQSGVATVEKAKMPPLYIAFRTTEANKGAASQQVAAMLDNIGQMGGPMVEPAEIEVAGQKFEGSRILGAKLSEQLAGGRQSMEEELDPPTVDRLLAAIAKKDIVVLSGTVGDYVLLFVGSSVDDLKLATDPALSIVGGEALAFTDAYAAKEMAAVLYGRKESMDTLMSSIGGFSDIANGLRDGLAGSDGLGDTRDLESMFQIVADRENALKKLTTTESAGIVAFFEDGFKIESYGGTDNGMVAWKATNKLGHLGDSEDVLMFADMTSDAAYDEAARAYVESLMETGYAMAMKVADSPLEGDDIAKFKETVKMFDAKFRPDLISLWDTFEKDFGPSLGKESVLVVDLKGGAPAIPNIPQKVLDTAKIPRVTVISPVTDRAKLSGSWDKINTTLTGTLAKVSEMAGTQIPMQKPMSSEKDGNTTWFFPMPFLTDDFVPSVTVSDKWFAASTSKFQALDLIGKAEAGGAAATSGVWFTMNFQTLQKYSVEMLKVYEDNAEALGGAPLTAENKKKAEDIIALVGDLDKLTVHTRREASGLRSSVHFKTR